MTRIFIDGCIDHAGVMAGNWTTTRRRRQKKGEGWRCKRKGGNDTGGGNTLPPGLVIFPGSGILKANRNASTESGYDNEFLLHFCISDC